MPCEEKKENQIPHDQNFIIDIAELPEVKQREKAKHILELLTEEILVLVRQIPKEISVMSAERIERVLEKEEIDPITVTDKRLRLALWAEYHLAVEKGAAKVYPMRIHPGVCSQGYWQKFISNPRKLAWLIQPPISYSDAIEECLEFGMQKIRDILSLPLYRKDGEANVPLIQAIIKAVNLLDMRKHGAITQRIEQKNLNLNAALLPNGQVSGITKSESEDVRNSIYDCVPMEEIEAEIQKLDKKFKRINKYDKENQTAEGDGRGEKEVSD